MARGARPSTKSENQTVNHNATVFLSLALLLLAFFALLNSFSTIEDRRSRQVIDSVVAAFSSPFGSLLSDDGTEPVGDLAFAERALSDVAMFVRKIIELVEVRVVIPGRSIEISFSADRIFGPQTAQITTDSEALLDRLATALINPPHGTRFELEAFVEYKADEPATPARLDIARAGAVGRALVNRGVDPDAIAVGLMAGRPATIRLVIHLRAQGDGPLYGQPVADPAETPGG